MKLARSLERIREMVRKEFLQIFRDPKLRRIILVAPVIQLIVFGYAVSTDVRQTTTFVVDHDHSRSFREICWMVSPRQSTSGWWEDRMTNAISSMLSIMVMPWWRS